MVVVSYSGKEINAKLVYYGAGLSGKTTNLESIYEAVPETSRGKMVSMKTQSDRTLFFDLLPLDLGEIMGFKTRFLLYTVPGQVFYNATRKLVLKGADAIVFVADSEVGKMDENKESLNNLRTNLQEYGLKIEDIPWVIQYNKRDLPEVYSVEELNAELNPDGKIPSFEAVAKDGKGVFETFRGISHLLMEKVTRELRRAPLAGSALRASKSEDGAAKAEPPSMGILDTVGLTPKAATPAEKHETPASPPVASPAVAAPAVASGIPDAILYGRELSLPGDAAPATAASEATTAGNGRDARLTDGAANLGAMRDLAESTPSVTDLAARQAQMGAFGTQLDLDGPRSTPAPVGPAVEARPLASVEVTTPVRVATPPLEISTSPQRPGMAAFELASSRPAASLRALAPAPSPTPATSESDPVVVPVRLPKGVTREIVLRIVITHEGE